MYRERRPSCTWKTHQTKCLFRQKVTQKLRTIWISGRIFDIFTCIQISASERSTKISRTLVSVPIRTLIIFLFNKNTLEELLCSYRCCSIGNLDFCTFDVTMVTEQQRLKNPNGCYAIFANKTSALMKNHCSFKDVSPKYLMNYLKIQRVGTQKKKRTRANVINHLTRFSFVVAQIIRMIIIFYLSSHWVYGAVVQRPL